MPSEIDTLMHLDPLDLSARDIDEIIAYNRKLMAAYDSGVKVKKDPGPKLDLESIGLSGKTYPKQIRRL
jgi:hypothetical protein